MRTEQAAQTLIDQLARPLESFTGAVCATYSHATCMFAAVRCKSTGFPPSLNVSGFDCAAAASCAEACGCCQVLAQVWQK